MSDLKFIEKEKLENALEMHSGYVLDFSNKSFTSFLKAYDIYIYDEKYAESGDSKANRMRSFWEKEDNWKVADVVFGMLEYWGYRSAAQNNPSYNIDLMEECRKIVDRLRGIKTPAPIFPEENVAKHIELNIVDGVSVKDSQVFVTSVDNSTHILSLVNNRELTNQSARGLEVFFSEVIHKYLHGDSRPNQLPADWKFLEELTSTLGNIATQTETASVNEKDKDKEVSALKLEIKNFQKQIEKFNSQLGQEKNSETPLRKIINAGATSFGGCVGVFVFGAILEITGFSLEYIGELGVVFQ